MIEFKSFSLATPPCTCGDWFLQQSKTLLGYPVLSDSIYEPPPIGYDKFVVSLVRHPYHWLEELFFILKQQPMLENHHCEQFFSLVHATKDFDLFVQKVASTPGSIGRFFDSYRPSNVMKIEEFPWGPMEFFKALDVPDMKIQLLRKQSPTISTVINPLHKKQQKALRTMIVESEQELCERYEYW